MMRHPQLKFVFAANLMATITIAIGLVMLSGWIFDISAFKGFSLYFTVFIIFICIVMLVCLNAIDQELRISQGSLKKNKDDAEKLSSNLKLLIDHSPGAAAMFDHNMRYIWASNRWIKDFHLEGKELIGHSHYEIFTEIPAHWKEVHQRCLKGAIESDEECFVRANGERQWIRWEIRPWHSSENEIGGIVIFSEDITERKTAQDKLEELNRELEQRVIDRTNEALQAIKARENVLFIVSHDLKNPLAVIDMSAQLILLNKEHSKESINFYAERIKNSALIMRRLISDVLDFSKMEGGTFVVDKQPVSVHKVISVALEGLSSQAEENGINLQIDVPMDIPNILADHLRIVQILWNLIGNAIKFTPKSGSISLKVKSEDKLIRFTVTDTGPGIDHKDLPYVFDRFWQADKRSAKGTGLGLSIAKGIVEAHGGQIGVESGPGKGTTFYFTIPAFIV